MLSRHPTTKNPLLSDSDSWTDVGHCGSLSVVAGIGNKTPKLQAKANSKFGDGSGVRKTSGL